MAKVKGTVKFVSQKFFGGLKLEGQENWFNGTEQTANLVKGCRSGEVIEIELNSTGKVEHLTKHESIGASASSPSATVPYKGYDEKRQSYIVRQNCLGHAVELVVGFKTEMAEEENFSAIETVKRLAEDLEKWVLR